MWPHTYRRSIAFLRAEGEVLRELLEHWMKLPQDLVLLPQEVVAYFEAWKERNF